MASKEEVCTVDLSLFCLYFCCGEAKLFNYNRSSLKLDDAAAEKEKELRQKRVRFFSCVMFNHTNYGLIQMRIEWNDELVCIKFWHHSIDQFNVIFITLAYRCIYDKFILDKDRTRVVDQKHECTQLLGPEH